MLYISSNRMNLSCVLVCNVSVQFCILAVSYFKHKGNYGTNFSQTSKKMVKIYSMNLILPETEVAKASKLI